MGVEPSPSTAQGRLIFHDRGRLVVPGFSPFYSTALGDAYLADSLDVLKALPDFEHQRAGDLAALCPKLVTDEGDLVLDPFAGSNTTGAVAEALHLRWIAVDNVEDYLEASKHRFFS